MCGICSLVHYISKALSVSSHVYYRFVSKKPETAQTEETYVRSHGRLNCFWHSLHSTFLTTVGADFRRRAMERVRSSTPSSTEVSSPGLGCGWNSAPVRREMALPFLILTNSASRPV